MHLAMPSTAVPSSPDDAPLVVKRLPRPVATGDDSPPPKMRNPPPVVQPKKLQAFAFRHHPLLDLQAREDKDGRSVSGSSNSSDDCDKSNLSCVTPTANHSNAEKHEYLAGMQSQNGFPTPIHEQRHSDLIFGGRELLADLLLEREEAKRLARNKAKTDDPTAYAAKKAASAAAKAEREAVRLARKLAKLDAGKKAPSPAQNASRPASRPASRRNNAQQGSPKVISSDSNPPLAPRLPSPAARANELHSPSSKVASTKEVIHVSSDSKPPLAPRLPSPAARANELHSSSSKVASPKEVIHVSSDSKPAIAPRLPYPAADNDLLQHKLHHFFKPFHRAAASTFTSTHEDKFHALVNRDITLTSPLKLVATLQPHCPPLAVARPMDPPLLITPQVLFPTAAGERSKSPKPSPSHLSQHMLSPVAKPATPKPSSSHLSQHMLSPVALPASLPLIRSHQSPRVQQSLSTTSCDLAKKKPNLQPSPTSHECDAFIPAAKKFLHSRLRLKRTQPLFCSGCFVEMCADVFNAAVQTSPCKSLEQAFSAAPVTAAVQTSPRNTIEFTLNVAVQTSPRCTHKQTSDKPVQTSPRDDPEKPVTVRDLRSAIHEVLVGLGLCLK